jgi:hypothetical protein
MYAFDDRSSFEIFWHADTEILHGTQGFILSLVSCTGEGLMTGRSPA